MTVYKNIMIFGEIADGNLSKITKELLGCGRRLADDLGEELCAVFIGSGIREFGSEAIALGADKIYVVDDPLLEDYRTDSFLWSMEKVVSREPPRIILLGQTSIGLDLSPRLAFRLGTPVVLDCVELSIDPETNLLLRTKPVYGGKAMATFTGDSYPQMATIRPNSMAPSEIDDSRHGEMIAVDADLDHPSLMRTKVVEKVIEEVEGIKLEDAKIIICGGRGIGSVEGFKQLEQLIEGLKGTAVGATRAACDLGWAPASIQIGLTGKIVSPNLYIAVALSGASQHITGCSASKTIAAINTDSEANIFKEAKFGVVGDWKMILPSFISEINNMLQE